MPQTITPVNDSTAKVQQSNLPLSVKPSAPSRFPIGYADNQWDIAAAESALAELAGAAATYDQHSLNELFARLILSLLPQPSTHSDFSDDFSDDFD